MRISFVTNIFLSLFVLAFNLAAQTVTCADSRNSQAAFPPIPTVIDDTCTVVPANFAGQIEQSNFDLNGCLPFLALNWPANPATCSADPNGTILSGKGPVVWQTYLEDS